MEQKRCSRCKEVKDRILFYAASRSRDSLKSQCIACHCEGNIRTRDPRRHAKNRRQSMRRSRERDPEKFRERDRLASRKRPRDKRWHARQVLNRAVQSARIAKPDICSRCGEARKITAHHPDYDKPLDVVWLCYECHANE